MKTPNYRALVVDDDRADRQLLKHQLHRLSFHVVEAADGRTALGRLTEEDYFDLIILDLMLPDMSGFQVSESVRNSPRHRQVPILVVSARTLPEDRAEAEQAGASGYLVKPFRSKDLHAEVRRLLALKSANAGR